MFETNIGPARLQNDARKRTDTRRCLHTNLRMPKQSQSTLFGPRMDLQSTTQGITEHDPVVQTELSVVVSERVKE